MLEGEGAEGIDRMGIGDGKIDVRCVFATDERNFILIRGSEAFESVLSGLQLNCSHVPTQAR